MFAPPPFVRFLVLPGMLALGACGGGEEGTGFKPPAPREDVVVGTITAFGSVWVNDIHFEIDSSTIIIDGVAGTTADLRLGMVATIEGTINPDNETGTARAISVDEALRGAVTAVTADSITVLGQTVRFDTATFFDSFSDISELIGSNVEISGYNESLGVVSATRIERLTDAPTQTKMQGAVENLDPAAKTFRIGTLVVNFANLTPAPTLSNGTVVDVLGIINAVTDQLDAAEITIKTVPVTDAPKFKYQGNVTVAFNAATGEFTVDNLIVRTNSNTQFENLSAAELLVGVRIKVEGALIGGIIEAKEIELPTTATTTTTNPTSSTESD